MLFSLVLECNVRFLRCTPQQCLTGLVHWHPELQQSTWDRHAQYALDATPPGPQRRYQRFCSFSGRREPAESSVNNSRYSHTALLPKSCVITHHFSPFVGRNDSWRTLQQVCACWSGMHRPTACSLCTRILNEQRACNSQMYTEYASTSYGHSTSPSGNWTGLAELVGPCAVHCNMQYSVTRSDR